MAIQHTHLGVYINKITTPETQVRGIPTGMPVFVGYTENTRVTSINTSIVGDILSKTTLPGSKNFAALQPVTTKPTTAILQIGTSSPR